MRCAGSTQCRTCGSLAIYCVINMENEELGMEHHMKKTPRDEAA
jgi:hypothetical protein